MVITRNKVSQILFKKIKRTIMKEVKTSEEQVVGESGISGEKIIFDILIKQKLAHVIVLKQEFQYKVNVDGEDIGSFEKQMDGTIVRKVQPKGAHQDLENYFKPVEAKIAELNK